MQGSHDDMFYRCSRSPAGEFEWPWCRPSSPTGWYLYKTKCSNYNHTHWSATGHLSYTLPVKPLLKNICSVSGHIILLTGHQRVLAAGCLLKAQGFPAEEQNAASFPWILGVVSSTPTRPGRSHDLNKNMIHRPERLHPQSVDCCEHEVLSKLRSSSRSTVYLLPNKSHITTWASFTFNILFTHKQPYPHLNHLHITKQVHGTGCTENLSWI